MANPFNHPQEKTDEGIEIAVQKYRYINTSSKKAQESVVEAGYKEIKKPSAEDVDSLVQDASKRGLQSNNHVFAGCLNSSMAASLTSSFGNAGGASNADEVTAEEVAKEAAQGRASSKDLISKLESILIAGDGSSPPPRPATTLPPQAPAVPEPLDAGWEILSAHSEANASVDLLARDCERALMIIN